MKFRLIGNTYVVKQHNSEGHSLLKAGLVIDSFTVPLHSPNGRHLPAIKAVQWDYQWHMKNGGNTSWSNEPTIRLNWGNPNLWLDQPITKGWHQITGNNVSYPTKCSNAKRLWLCSSLICSTYVRSGPHVASKTDPKQISENACFALCGFHLNCNLKVNINLHLQQMIQLISSWMPFLCINIQCNTSMPSCVAKHLIAPTNVHTKTWFYLNPSMDK